MRARDLLAAVAIAAFGVAAAHAGQVVAPNSNAAAPGYEYQASIFGNGSTSTVQFQEGFDASQFSSIAPGSRITGIGYRLPTNFGTETDSVSYSDFTVRIGQSSVPTASLSTDEASNLGSDTITARTGAFTIPANALVNNGDATNPFFTINFDTPYTYQGGDLLLTTSYSVTGTVPFIGVDAIDPVGPVNTVAGNDPAFLRTHFYNAPVVAFVFGAVPEPASWLMMITGFGLTGAAMRRRRAAGMVHA